MEQNSTTGQLADILSEIDSTKEMEQYLETPKVADSFHSFPEFFRSLPAYGAMDSGDLILQSGLERSYFYQVMKGTRSPGRDKVLRLCLAAGLSLKETTRALELSGNAVLYPRNRRDIILTVAINQKAGVIDTNLLLTQYGEKPLQ
ncbi:MAG: XRE family transcriptional regulator [Sarcina sp.]|nr:XRE family transcriptional regulator [Sarcina sp.]